MTTLRVTLTITLDVEQATWNRPLHYDGDCPVSYGDEWCQTAEGALRVVAPPLDIQVISVKPQTAVLVPVPDPCYDLT